MRFELIGVGGEAASTGANSLVVSVGPSDRWRRSRSTVELPREVSVYVQVAPQDEVCQASRVQGAAASTPSQPMPVASTISSTSPRTPAAYPTTTDIADRPILVTTHGGSTPPEGQLPIEFAIELLDGQQDAAQVVLQNLCDDLAGGSLSRAQETPWRNDTPLLDDTNICALAVSASRYGDAFDVVVDEAGEPIAQVLTIRLLTYPESWVVERRGFEQLAAEAGGVDQLLDVTRETTLFPTVEDIANRPILVTNFHEQYPPIWVTCDRVNDGTDLFNSTTGAESPEYLADSGNYQAWTCALYMQRFPWTTGYLTHSVPETVAHFTDDTGSYTMESTAAQ